MHGLTLAADLGGTSVKLGVLERGAVVARARLPAEATGSLEARLPDLEGAFRRLLAETDADLEAVRGVGVALPCLLSRDRRRVLSAIGKYPDAETVDLEAWARETWGAPVVLEGDAVAALLGEWRHGAARDCQTVAMLTFGTGIGSAAILEGAPYRGAHGAGGVLFGHLTVDLEGERCPCGNVGCVEALASTWSLRREHGPRADLEWLFSGDAPETLRAHVLEAWGVAVVNVVHALDPERVVLGGGAMRAGDQILPSIREHVRAHAWRPPGLEVAVVAGTLGDDAALLGLEWAVQTSYP